MCLSGESVFINWNNLKSVLLQTNEDFQLCKGVSFSDTIPIL